MLLLVLVFSDHFELDHGTRKCQKRGNLTLRAIPILANCMLGSTFMSVEIA